LELANKQSFICGAGTWRKPNCLNARQPNTDGQPTSSATQPRGLLPGHLHLRRRYDANQLIPTPIITASPFSTAIPQGGVEFGIASGGAIFKGARQRRREGRCWRRPECEDKSPVRCEGDVLKCQRADCTKPVCRLAEGGPFNRSIRVEAPPNVPGTGRAIGSLAIGSAFPIAPICRELWQRVQTPRSR